MTRHNYNLHVLRVRAQLQVNNAEKQFRKNDAAKKFRTTSHSLPVSSLTAGPSYGFEANVDAVGRWVDAPYRPNNAVWQRLSFAVP